MIKKIKVLLLGFTVPDEVAQQLFRLDPYPAVQTHKFAWSLARALEFGVGQLELASVCPVQNYPLVRKIIFKGGRFRVNTVSGILLGFVNIIGIKHLSRFLACVFFVSPQVWRGKADWIVVHGVHSPFLLFANIAQIFGCRFAVVLTDPPGVILPTDGLVTRYLKRFDAWLLGRLLKRANAVFALAQELAAQLTPTQPALVFPGILNSEFQNLNEQKSKESASSSDSGKPFTVVYAGGLQAAYGIDRLVEAVAGLDHLVQLRIFGRGDQEDRLRELAETDSRFFYGGFVNSEELLPELRSADLLINPRPTNERFAEMSFPSKLIEYLSIGRPVLTTRIKSIPQSFEKCFLFIEDESSEGIRAAILRSMHMPDDERKNIGAIGEALARTELSEKALGKKIGQFLQAVDESC